MLQANIFMKPRQRNFEYLFPFESYALKTDIGLIGKISTQAVAWGVY